VTGNSGNSDGTTTVYRVSAVVDIVVLDQNGDEVEGTTALGGGNVTFVMPIGRPDLTRKLGEAADPCKIPELRCEWYDVANERWNSSGCALLKRTEVDVTCNCNHLTQFALILRTTKSNTFVCHNGGITAYRVVLACVYGLLFFVALGQVGRLVRANEELLGLMIRQHAAMAVVCMVNCIFVLWVEAPQALALFFENGVWSLKFALLAFFVATWAGIAFKPMSFSPFASMERPFRLAIGLTLLVTFVLPVPLLLLTSAREALALVGVLSIATLSFVVSVAVFTFGMRLGCILNANEKNGSKRKRKTSSSSSKTDGKTKNDMSVGKRLQYVAVILSLFMGLQAALSVTLVIVIEENYELVNFLHYMCDIASIATMLFLLSGAVRKRVMQAAFKVQRRTNSASTPTPKHQGSAQLRRLRASTRSMSEMAKTSTTRMGTESMEQVSSSVLASIPVYSTVLTSLKKT